MTAAARCAFSVDAPDQLAKLSPRLQQTLGELLARCALDLQTYPQLIHTQQRGGVLDTTPAVHAITPAGQDSTTDGQATTNKYKEERQKKK